MPDTQVSDNDRLEELDAKIQELNKVIRRDKRTVKIAGLSEWQAEDVTEIFIRPRGSFKLLQLAKTVIGKVKNAPRPNRQFLHLFYGSIEEVHTHIKKTLNQHRILQFFMEEEIRNELSALHTKLTRSCNFVVKGSEDQFKQAKKDAEDAEDEDTTGIRIIVECVEDVTQIGKFLGCNDTPPKGALKEVSQKSVLTASLFQDYKKCIERDWFFLTFKSEWSRQQIKAPLTRIVNEIIPELEALSDDDKIALSSNELHRFEMVNRLFAILDNSKDPALKLVRSLRHALATTDSEISGSIKEGRFVDFALNI